MFSQDQALRRIRLLIAMRVTLTICRADPEAVEKLLIPQEIRSARVVHSTDWRKAVQAEFKYTPPTSSQSSVAVEDIRETPVDDKIVVLEKFVVRDAATDYRELEKVTRPPRKGANKVMKKLGIGVHEVKFRDFTFGAATIFYLPVAVGISW